MANYGLSHPIIAKYDEETKKYTDGFQCGEAVSTNVTPNYNEASLYGDDRLVEYVKEFKEADVTLGVTRLPVQASTVMFNHKVDEETGEVMYGGESPNVIGYGFYTREMENGRTKYSACWLPRTQIAEGADDYTTKGESIEFKNPSLAGKAKMDDTQLWKYIKKFETEAEAVAYLKGKAGITDGEIPAGPAETPTSQDENAEI